MWNRKTFQAHFEFFLTNPRFQPFLQESWLFVLENDLETKIWVVGVPMAFGDVAALEPSQWAMQRRVDV